MMIGDDDDDNDDDDGDDDDDDVIGDDGSRIFYHCPLYACLLQVKSVPMT